VVREHGLCRNLAGSDGDAVGPATGRASGEVLADRVGGIDDGTVRLLLDPAGRTRVNDLHRDTLAAALAHTKLCIAAKAHGTGGIGPVAVATALSTGSGRVTERGKIVLTVTGDGSAAAALAVAGEVSRVGCSSSSSQSGKRGKRETHIQKKREKEKGRKKKKKQKKDLRKLEKRIKRIRRKIIQIIKKMNQIIKKKTIQLLIQIMIQL